MYKLLLVSDQENVLNAFAQVDTWDMNGFKARTLRKSDSPYSEIYDVRDYILGDPIKNIHWKAYPTSSYEGWMG